MKALDAAILLMAGAIAHAQTVKTAEVVAGPAERTIRVPGEFLPYQTVDLHARVSGFVECVKVDRGSTVRKGDLLVTLSAPEMKAQILEARARVKSLESQVLEAEAKLLASQAVYERLKTASQTPGAIAGVELIQAEKSLASAKAAREAAAMSAEAAHASLDGLLELERYLTVAAPFDGVITERFVHPGALAGPGGGAGAAPLLRLEQLSRLRLVVPVPEADAGHIPRGARVTFRVRAFPGEIFHGTVARIGRALDPKTRTMPVEVDVQNAGRLSPGMYPEVEWPVRLPSALMVPSSSIVTTTARSFVIRVTGGRAEWVDVRRVRDTGERAIVTGELKAGDRVVVQATDEIRDGSTVQAVPVQ